MTYIYIFCLRSFFVHFPTCTSGFSGLFALDFLVKNFKLWKVYCKDRTVLFLQLKGADRKHKQDREKILKRPPLEQEKFQPSYDCTVFNDVSFTTPLLLSSNTFSCNSQLLWPHTRHDSNLHSRDGRCG
jgi:type II restriction/modification system DNA methylase subunit YeeA